MKRVVIIGGGASGMASAYSSSTGGAKVTLLEKNEKLGKKVFISGKGRCNLTNASDIETIMNNVVTNQKFLYSALYTFTNDDIMKLVEENGCPVKVERGNRVFPVSDHSSDVIKALTNAIRKRNVDIQLNTEVKEILTEDTENGKVVTGVRVKRRTGVKEEVIPCDSLILCTGGVSYPSTGSTGDGHRFSEDLGHKVTGLLPALVPFETKEDWVYDLSGLSLKNVGIKVTGKRGVYYEDFGEMLFTHFGVSGPLILSASSVCVKKLSSEGSLNLFIDLKPALSVEQLEKRLLRDFDENKNKQFRNALSGLLPQKLISVVISASGILPEKPVNELKKEERKKLVEVLKALPLTICGTRGMNEAIVTQGGVAVKEVDPSTMESKKVKGLYFAGELLDIDAFTGGYNLQLAWSTGYLAGLNAAEE